MAPLWSPAVANADPHAPRGTLSSRDLKREQGRQRLYRLNGHALKPIHDWVKAYEQTWSERFEQLDVVLEDLKQKEQP
jgi:hypothetical protein